MAIDLHKNIDDYYESEESIRKVNNKFKVTETSDMYVIKVDVENDI